MDIEPFTQGNQMSQKNHNHPIPQIALDERIGIIGTSGSGKTYAALGMTERLLQAGSRVIIIDPLGVSWGLRLTASGKRQSKYKAVIFGGKHGDLPLSEKSASLIGEALATADDSAIIDLSDFPTKASERRFMLAFLKSLYKNANGEPVHIIMDEADEWAPQRILDKEGDATKLLGMVQTLVRRGRVKGFIPWLITQRLSVISKDVISQIDGMITFKVTSINDRATLAQWVDGSADSDTIKALKGNVPSLKVGTGVIWFPSREIFKTASFPTRNTFDSSRTPKRGEKRSRTNLAALNIGKLKAKLADVEAEITANDPNHLKAEIKRLKASLQSNPTDTETLDTAKTEGFDRGYGQGHAAASKKFQNELETIKKRIDATFKEANSSNTSPVTTKAANKKPQKRTVQTSKKTPPFHKAGLDKPTQPQIRVLTALKKWKALGHNQPTRIQVATLSNYKPKSGTFANLLSSMKSLGVIEYPTTNHVCLCDWVFELTE